MFATAGFEEPGCAAATIFTVEQPPYLLNNWRTLQAQGDDIPQYSYVKYVRSLGGVLTITNGVSMIRYATGAPDGFYIIDAAGRFVGVNPEKDNYYQIKIPDPESIKPEFPVMDRTGMIPRAEIAKFVEFLNYIRQSNNMIGEKVNVVLVDDVAVKDRSYMDKNGVMPEFAFPFRMPFKEGLRFDANALRIVFTEMLRYEEVQLLYDNLSHKRTPLVVGRGWGNCGLIMPRI